jgi:hypothetical protein
MKLGPDGTPMHKRSGEGHGHTGVEDVSKIGRSIDVERRREGVGWSSRESLLAGERPDVDSMHSIAGLQRRWGERDCLGFLKGIGYRV